jgi:hypothetical protein
MRRARRTLSPWVEDGRERPYRALTRDCQSNSNPRGSHVGARQVDEDEVDETLLGLGTEKRRFVRKIICAPICN